MPKRSSGSARIFWPAFDRAGLIRRLEEGARRLESDLPLVKVVLFGSHAAGRATVASDVDVLVVYRGAPRPDAYAVTRRALAVPRVEPHLYTEEEYRAAASTVDRMARGGVILLER
jgi:predicted nucleotidyltransferase